MKKVSDEYFAVTISLEGSVCLPFSFYKMMNLSEMIRTEIPDPGKEEIMAKNNEFIQNLKKIMEEYDFAD